MSSEADQRSVTCDVFSPRWGHADPYTIQITSSQLSVHSNTFNAECSVNEDGEPTWTGYNAEMGNPLMQIFSNDSIYAPEAVPEALEWALGQWHDKSMSESDMIDGIRELFDWIDKTARAKPSGPLWQPYF